MKSLGPTRSTSQCRHESPPDQLNSAVDEMNQFTASSEMPSPHPARVMIGGVEES